MKRDTDLTDTEHTVLKRLGEGWPYKTVAASLGISVSTVNTHRRRGYRKLGAEHIVAAVRRMRSRNRARSGAV